MVYLYLDTGSWRQLYFAMLINCYSARLVVALLLLKVSMRFYMLCLYTCYSENCRDSLVSADSQHHSFIHTPKSVKVSGTNPFQRYMYQYVIRCSDNNLFTAVLHVYVPNHILYNTITQSDFTLCMNIFQHRTRTDKFEQKHQVCPRWKPGDEDFCIAQSLFCKDKQDSLRPSVWAVIVKQQYLIKLEEKYGEVWYKLSHF